MICNYDQDPINKKNFILYSEIFYVIMCQVTNLCQPQFLYMQSELDDGGGRKRQLGIK